MKKTNTILQLLLALLIIMLILIFKKNIVFVFETLSEYFYPKKNDGKAEFLKVILSILGALGIMWGIVISLRRAKAIERGVELQHKAIINQTEELHLGRKAQIDERFKNAIEHLGSEKEPIILGGIAELYQIAKENQKDYSEIVFNILCSYIRTKANIYNVSGKDINKTPIQTIINYLFKNYEIEEYPFIDYQANLSSTNLLTLNLDNANFVEANLSFCDLPNIQNSKFKRANLGNSIFRIAKLKNIDFSEAKLSNAIFHFSELKNVNFDNISYLSNANFCKCKMENISMNNTKGFSTKFIASEIDNITFLNSTLIEVSFALSNIKNIDFSSLELFSKCDFRGSCFTNVKFKNYIMECRFQGAINFDNYSVRTMNEKDVDKIIGRKTDVLFVDTDANFHKCDLSEFSVKDKAELMDKIEEIEKMELPNQINNNSRE